MHTHDYDYLIIVWAAVMLPPKKAFYQDPILKNLKLDLETELPPI